MKNFTRRIILLVSVATGICMSPAKAQVSITCPADIEVSNDPGECDAVVNFTPPEGTGVGTNITTTQLVGLPAGSTFPVGTTEMVFQVTNDEGDNDQCTFYVIVADSDDPVIDCPPDIYVDADPGTCEQIVEFDFPPASDNCGVISMNQIGGLSSGSSFPVGENFIDFEAVDAYGNSAFCRVIINVADVNLPTISCPEDITVSTTADCGAVVNYTAPVGVDQCLPSNTTQTGGLGSGAFFPIGTTTETYEVQDLQGNIATCSFNITVLDEGMPEFDFCPADMVLNAAPGACDAVAIFPTPTASDNCPDVTVTQTQGFASGESFPAGTTEVVFTATDASGNSVTCSFEVTVIEDAPPEITCPADMVVSNDPETCGAIVNYVVPIGTDNCDGAITTLIAGLGSGAEFPVGTTTETYEVTDASGNTATCSFNITVEDVEAPTITCPEDISVETDPGACAANVVFADPIATDNCVAVTVVQTAGLPSGSDFPTGSNTVEFTATDAEGNTTICSFDVVVNDAEPPTITCPDDIVTAAPAGTCEAEVIYPVPVVDDNCAGTTWAVISGPESGDIVPVGDHVVTLEATDAAGNTTTCTFQITVTESTPPTFICPDDITVNTDVGACDAVVTFSDPIATDDCSDVTVTQTGGPASGSTFPAGVTTIEFTATDAFGNTEICSFEVLVVDDTDPIIECPENISASNDPGLCGAVVNYDPPMASDSCGLVTITLVEGPASGDFFPVGTTSVTFQAEDASGNTALCSFDVVITDNEAPVPSCPPDLFIDLPAGDCAQIVNYTLPTATDNCGVESTTLLSGPASGEEFQVGTTTVTYAFTDEAGNTSQCSFDVVLSEDVDPEITCPADIVLTAEEGLCGASVSYTPPVGTDNCAVESTVLTSGLGSGAFFPVGTTTETYTVTDLSGNQATCSFTITVTDDEAPVFVCNDDLIAATDPGVCEAVVHFDAPAVSDNCDNAVVPIQTAGLPSGSTFPLGTTTIEFTATDADGNASTCTFDVIVEDQEGPEMTCPADIEISAANGDCDAEVNFAPPVANDNCGTATVTQTAGPASGSLFPAGSTTVEFTATDDAGNTTVCTFEVIVTEDVDPEITCPDDISTHTDPDACSAVVTYNVEATDDCGEVTLVLIEGLESGEAFPLGITTVVYEATDGSGNVATCSFTVEVLDEQAPDIDCPESVNLSTDEGSCGAVYEFELPTATDACDPDVTVIQTGGPASGSELPVGTTVFTFTATDASGNVETCTLEVTVTDDENPVVSDCPDDIVVHLSEDACEIPVSFDAPTVSDNCSAVIEQISGPASDSLLTAGVYNVEFLAEDAAGNTTLCSFSITVLDTIAPVIQCPESFEICGTLVEFDMPTASDICGEVDVIQTAGPESGSLFPIGVTVLEFQATDLHGNTATCTFEVEVLQEASRPQVEDIDRICDASEVMLEGSVPSFGVPEWELIEGEGNILDPNSPTTEVIGLTTGTHVFVYSVDPENGCPILTDTVVVVVETDVFAEAGDDTSIMLGGSTQLQGIVSSETGVHSWHPPQTLSCEECLDPLASPTESTQYFLSFTSSFGCEAVDSMWVRVFTELPNTITPDGDGVNDVWNIPGIDNYSNPEVYIYNRWGVEVYASQGQYEPWDGTHEGDDLPTGSYFYIIKYNEPGISNQEGTLNIIR